MRPSSIAAMIPLRVARGARWRVAAVLAIAIGAAETGAGLAPSMSSKYMPTWDWSKDKLLDTIERSGISLPVDYLWFGRSFDGLDYRFLGPLKRHAPRDYAKVLEWFPLADIEVWRHEKSAA